MEPGSWDMAMDAGSFSCASSGSVFPHAFSTRIPKMARYEGSYSCNIPLLFSVAVYFVILCCVACAEQEK